MDMQQNKFIVRAGIAVVFGICLLIIGFGLKDIGKTSVTVNLAPTSAELVVDGKTVDPGTIDLPKGEHTIEAFQEGFRSFSQKITVPDTETVDILLVAESDDAKQFLVDNPDQQQEIEGLSGRLFNERADRRMERYPYLTQLPLAGSKFSVSQGLAFGTKKEPESAIALYIDAPNPAERRNALKNMIDAGIKLEDVEIIFENQVNLFDQEAGGD